MAPRCLHAIRKTLVVSVLHLSSKAHPPQVLAGVVEGDQTVLLLLLVGEDESEGSTTHIHR